MGNKFYAPGETRGRKVQELFARIAPRYDLINDLQSFGLHRLWKRKLICLTEPRRGERALDVCCGTGDLTLGLARKGVEVTGIDFSEAMLAVARERLSRERNPESLGKKIDFVPADAENLPYPDDSFDIVTVGYGLRNLSDWRAGLAEMQRVSKTRGRLLVLDFGKPDNAIWRAIYFGYLRLVVPLFGKAFCGDAQTYSYILESLIHFPAQKGIAAALQELGCSDVRTYNLLGGIMSINYAQKG